MKIAVYPGSFDPVTNGHIDIIERAAEVFDKVYVAILKNSSKNALFSTEERKVLIERVTVHIPNIEVVSFEGLLVDMMREKKATVIIKGLRAISDFEYEFQMALTNRQLAPEVETLFMMTRAQNQYLSSSIVKEVARYNASLDGMVPPEIQEDIYRKIGQQ
ncbi:MAG: pantetheine-phosphate adenylyltransferase [Clostridia bacterium]|nr:pantetheine-phosphate adenylyltransferase [Oscillospiraceae bacterium]MBQ7033942.1 pantetheine-phosphate adenylyltransferase [Clostridia bacterium]